jgi:ABC-type antimicrobial peptide transport system permease subunit
MAVAISTISMLVVGIASGIVPAIRAERLQVIEALRSE